MTRYVALLAAAAAIVFSTGSAGCAQIPHHIPVWAFDERTAEGDAATPEQVRRYVTYAEGGLNNDKAVRDCAGSGACSSVFYFDPNLVYDSPSCPYSGDKDVLAAAREDWFVHLSGYSDAAHRVRGTYAQTCKGVPTQVAVYELNQRNPAVALYFETYLHRVAADWDFFEMDDTAATVTDQMYGPGGGFCKTFASLNGYCRSTAEIPSDRDVVAAHGAFANALHDREGRPLRFFFNSLAFGPDGARLDLLADPQFVGAICENCIVDAGAFRPSMYDKVLDAMARIDTMRRGAFVELNTGTSPAGSDDQIAQRLVTTAVAWLGFSDGHTIVWPNLEDNTHNLAAWPEDELYPSEPIQTMRLGARDLAVAPSVWRREFRKCYRDGVSIGPCAAVLNGSGAPVRPSQLPFTLQYRHAVQLRGGDSLSGGSFDEAVLNADASIAPGRAILLLR